jgi:hypothetical protein
LNQGLHSSFSERTCEDAVSIDAVAPHKLLYRHSDSVCASTVFSSLEKHRLLASMDPHNPLDETHGATNFLSLSFLCSRLISTGQFPCKKGAISNGHCQGASTGGKSYY